MGTSIITFSAPGIKRAKEYLEEGCDWVVDIVLAKFFDEVNHGRLMARLEQRIADRRVLGLVRQMLRARVVLPDGVVVATERGTPQGRVLVMIADKALQLVNDKLKAQTPRNWGQSFDECIRRVNVFLRGGLGYFAICDKKQLAGLGRIDGHLRRRLRAILLRQWKRKGHIVRQLVGLGVPPPLARVDINVGRRSWGALSEKRAAQRGLTKAYFDLRAAIFDLWRSRAGTADFHQHSVPADGPRNRNRRRSPTAIGDGGDRRLGHGDRAHAAALTPLSRARPYRDSRALRPESSLSSRRSAPASPPMHPRRKF